MQKSDQINELATALSMAQAQFPTVKKDAENPFFKSKYADLAALIEAVQKPLSDNGLAIMQLVTTLPEGKTIGVETVLTHKSGQFISEVFYMPVLDWKPQGLGSTVTYCRRYSLQSFLNLGAADDDGEAGQARDKKHDAPNEFAPKPKAAPKAPYQPVGTKAPQPVLLDGKGRQIFWADCKKVTDDEELIRAAINTATGKTTTKDLYVHETGRIIEELREMVQQRSGRPNPFDEPIMP